MDVLRHKARRNRQVRVAFMMLVMNCLLLGETSEVFADGLDFDTQVAPILASYCIECHQSNEPEGGLNLSDGKLAVRGGESGRAIIANNPTESLLWQRINHDEMPPKSPLPDAEKKVIRQWIDSGAKWGTQKIDPFRYTSSNRAGYDWWSFQKIGEITPPSVNNSSWVINPIDRFVLHRLEENKISPSPMLDPRLLVRRLYFDLIGLPPEPEIVESFVMNPSEEAYSALVDSLLSSEHYGERWARHWLDVVRFGESNGYEYDEPRDNFWHYRNWVIAALNNDIRYNDFIKQQIAGDVIDANSPDMIAAAGFLVAGPHNTTLPQNTKMRMSMRQDELEELVAVISQSFLGLTANCGRCHDHKFDPISQKEYYQFAAALAGVQHGQREIRDEVFQRQNRRREQLEKESLKLQKQLDDLENLARQNVLSQRNPKTTVKVPAPKPFARWEFDGDLKDKIGQLHGELHGSAKLSQGGLLLDGNSYVTTKTLSKPLKEKTLEAWVKLDELNQRGGGVIGVQTVDGNEFDSIVYGEREPRQWMAGSDVFRRTKSFSGESEDQAGKQPIHIAVVYRKDGEILGYRNGKPYGKSYRSVGIKDYPAGKSNVVIGMRHAPPGNNKMLRGTIYKARLYDRALTSREIANSSGRLENFVSEKELLASFDPQQQLLRRELLNNIEKINAEKKSLSETRPLKYYSVVPKKPVATHLLLRGDVSTPGEAVQPGGFASLKTLDSNFHLSADSPEGKRREKLAEWISDEKNPLTPRVIVNRLWHSHFGQGIVETPNDFGFNGGKPSHPRLLDWLAAELLRQDWRLKPIHRLIVTSATYRQSSQIRPGPQKVDADNRLLWRMPPQRLDAESLRDAMFAISGKLDRQIGGRGYRDVRHYKYKGSNFYELLDQASEQMNRRTIYRFMPRGGRNPFLDTFDCPDPSATTPKRSTTTTPLQALSLLNNSLVFHLSEQLSQRVQSEHENDLRRQLVRIYKLTFSRQPGKDELPVALSFVKKHSLPAFCRVLFNSNEFIYVR